MFIYLLSYSLTYLFTYLLTYSLLGSTAHCEHWPPSLGALILLYRLLCFAISQPSSPLDFSSHLPTTSICLPLLLLPSFLLSNIFLTVLPWYTQFWWRNLWERDHLVDLGLDGRIILRWIFRNWDVRLWTGSSRLRIGTDGGHLWKRWRKFGFHKMWEISWLSGNWWDTQGRLCSVDKESPSLIHSYYMSTPFQSFLFNVCYYVSIFI